MTAVRTIRAGRLGLRQFPRARLVTVGAIKKSAGRTHFYAVATLRTVKPAAVRSNNRVRSASTGFDGILAHPFVADTSATLAENAALRIVGHHRRQVSLGLVILFLGEAFFESTPVKGQLLQ